MAEETREAELRESLLPPGTNPDSEAAGAVPTSSNGGEEDGAGSSRNECNNDTSPTLQQPKEFKAPEIINNAAREVEEALANYDEMRVLLVGKSGVGKSSFVNCLLQANKAPVGIVKPETSEVTEYVLTDVGAGDNASDEPDDKVKIRVYDTPGFGARKKDNEKFVSEIRKRCEVADVIFLCIRMDDQLRVEDKQTIALLAKKFDDKFWGKCLIVFTRANMITRMGQHTLVSENDYFIKVKNDLEEEIRNVFKEAKVRISPQFVLAGAPKLTPEGRMIPSIDGAHEKVDWLPLVVAKLFESGCSDKAKAILLKSGWKKWAQVSAGTGASTAVGVALGGGIVAVGVATLVLPPLGEIAIVIGAAVIAASLVSGGASAAFGGKAAADKSKTKKQVDRALKKMKKE